MHKDDAELTSRLFAGDKSAWKEFVALYSKPIYGAIEHTLIKYHVSVKKTHETGLQGDIFHDIFLTLIESNFAAIRGFEGRNNCRLKSFLRTHATSRTIDYLNKIKLTSLEMAERKKPSGCAERDQKKKIVDALSVEPDISFFKAQEIGLDQLLDKLDVEERAFVQIAFLSELSSKEGAKKLGLSVGAYDMRRKRIKDQLREIANNLSREDG
ncbi:MAG: sigma-70 family RNA polymerase sigma factor [Candidatus Omnitrophica bacterium]|nr:sigma-70 family RNA polymerase sigma factor [Candidatus Omnitrophota bacterium]